MAELLLEIFCEEIPARMQKRAGADLTKALTDGLQKAGLSLDNVTSFYGPRRLTFAADIPARSPDISEERKGPRVGSPEQALAGFMRGAGLTDISQAEIRSDKKGDHYVAVIAQEGRDAGDIISELVPDVMNNFPWPKSMKSGNTTFKWVRPLQRILCIFDSKIVPFEVGGIASGNETEGHRRLGKGPYTIKGLSQYFEVLETKGHVVLDAGARADIILNEAKAACGKKGLELVEDAGLLAEVAGLAEYPVVILGDMDPAFLELPAEVIRLSMRTHQKYFAVKDPKTGKLAPHFIVVANQAAPDGGKAIAEGNSRVLSARLADAQFFQQEDAKKSLIEYYDKLDTVVFHKKLGSIKDKAERVAALARELAPKVGAEPDKAEHAAKLAKCDLVTNMVIEFTSLQGQIGRLMYEAETTAAPSDPAKTNFRSATSPAAAVEEKNRAVPGSSTAVAGEVGAKRSEGAAGLSTFSAADRADIAIAIEEHYKPQGPSDSVPTNPVAIAVALADKLDTLVGFWAIDEKPTGSKDPFALRRAALGAIRIVLENSLRIDLYKIGISHFLRVLMSLKRNADLNLYTELAKMIEKETETNNLVSSVEPLYDALCSRVKVDENEYKVVPDADDTPENLLAWATNLLIDLDKFTEDRFKVYLRDQRFDHDHIEAVLQVEANDFVAIVNRVNALQDFLGTTEGTDLLAGYKRAANILKAEAKKGKLPDGEPGKGTQVEETALFTALTTAQPAIENALGKEDYAGAMGALAGLRGPIDAFFDKVTVNSDNSEERANRLRLLTRIRAIAQSIADFDKIDG